MSIPFIAPTAAQSRDSMLRTISNGLINRGVANPNVNPGSDDYILAQAVANEVEVVSLNTVVAADQLMPDTATGANLVRIMAIYGLSPRPAGPSSATGVFVATATTLVPTNAQLLDQNGNPFKVTIGGSYSNNALIPIQSVGVGSGTNLPGGSVLKWVSPPPYSSPTMALSSNGASGGVDAENDDSSRSRLLQQLSQSPKSGNPSQSAGYAVQGDPSISLGFVYSGVNGGGTLHICVIGFATASLARKRAVSAAAVASAAGSVINQLPAFNEVVVTTTNDISADLSFLLTLPASTTAVPAGTGGGFIDAAPFPSVSGATNQFMRVSADLAGTSTSFSVESMLAPLVGESVCWIDRDTFTLHQGKITIVGTTYASPSGGTPGRFGITIDTPFVSTVGSIPVTNDYIFPAATNTQNYLNAVLAQFAILGPGEKTSSTGLLPRAYRSPRYFAANTYNIDDAFLRGLSNSGPEVLAAAYAANGKNGGVTAPAIPTLITGSPGVFVPRQIGFYST